MSNTPNVPMDDAHLKQYAINAAKEAKRTGSISCRALIKPLRANLKQIREAREALNLWSVGRTALPGAAEWLLDNHYLAVREGRRAIDALKGGKPLRGTAGKGTLLQSCVRGMLWAVPDLEQDRLALYLDGFQSVCPLTERELSLLIPALAGALAERLAGLCGDLDAIKEDRVPPEAAASVFNALRILSETEWSFLLEGVNQKPIGEMYFYYLPKGIIKKKFVNRL